MTTAVKTNRAIFASGCFWEPNIISYFPMDHRLAAYGTGLIQNHASGKGNDRQRVIGIGHLIRNRRR